VARRRKLGNGVREFSDESIRASALKARDEAFIFCIAQHDNAQEQKACVRGAQFSIQNLEKGLRIRILDGTRKKRRR
jgi:hypothetical protein